MKPLLQRRTFWKGYLSGAASLALFVVAVVVIISMMTPKEVYRLRTPWEPRVVYEPSKTPELISFPECDTRGKDCVVFDLPEKDVVLDLPEGDVVFYFPEMDVVRTVPEPGTLLLLCTAVIVIPLVKRLTRKPRAV